MTDIRPPSEEEREARNERNLAMPEGLSGRAQALHKKLVAWLKRKDMHHTGGCKAFYSPGEWRARGEKYGCDSELVIVHDGGDLWYVFDIDSELNCGRDPYFEKVLKEVFAPLGLYFEACTSWYTAVYPSMSR
jgi:hypothetical protein